MPKELPERIKRLMEDQAEEAALPVSYSVLRSVKPEAAEDPPGESDEVTPSPSDEVPQNEVQPAPEDWQVADPNEGNEQSQPPEDWNQPQGELTAPPEDWEQADEEVEPSGPDAALEVPESGEEEPADDKPDPEWDDSIDDMQRQFGSDDDYEEYQPAQSSWQDEMGWQQALADRSNSI